MDHEMASEQRIVDMDPSSDLHPVEVPIFFAAGQETLFGILTQPAPNTVAYGTAVMILAGGATPVTTNRNRLSVRLCRDVAARGFHAFRLDYHGAGESTGMVERLRLDQPFDEDADGGLLWMQQRGIEDFVLVGSCFGARVALAEAAVNEQVRRLILVAAPSRDAVMGNRQIARTADEWSIWRFMRRALHPRILRGWFDGNRRRLYRRYAREKWRAILRLTRHRFNRSKTEDPSWISSQFLEQFRTVVDRRVRVLLLFGESDSYYTDFRRGLDGTLGKLIEEAGDLIDLRVLPGQIHGFTQLSVQDAVLKEILDWLAAPDTQGSRSVPIEVEDPSVTGGPMNDAAEVKRLRQE
jgi:pimeloyl-ACP methyl ester carboxylesterase